MTRILHHTLPTTTMPGAGPLANNGLKQLDTFQHDSLSQGTLNPFANEAPLETTPTVTSVVKDAEMLVPSTASLYSPASNSIGDILGRATAPYFDAIQNSVRRLLRRDPPAIYTTLPTEQDFMNPPSPVARMGIGTKTALITTAGAAIFVAGCSSKSNPLVSALFQTLGGLGIFFVGMKSLSDGMNALSGSTLTRVISTLTKTRLSAFTVGLGITGLIQSSSITTSLAVGAVDAGVMQLYAALGITLGSHIGTTATGWLLATKIAQYGLPIIGLSAFPATFSKNEKTKTIGMTAVGLGMVFLGLATMSCGLGSPEIKGRLITILAGLHDTSYLGILTSMACGLLVTLGVQSSSATLGIVMSLASKGIIPFETGAAVMLGANMGTPVTAVLSASRAGTKPEARRVAMAHVMFHWVGALLLIFPFSPQLMSLSKQISESIFGNDPKIHVATFHTLNNILTATIFLVALKRLMPLLRRGLPTKEASGEADFGQQRLSRALLEAKSPGLALKASHGVIASEMNQRVEEMFQHALAVMSGKPLTAKREQKMRELEADLDHYQVSLGAWLLELTQNNLTKGEAVTRRAQRSITEQLESISDHLLKLFLHYKKPAHETLPQDAQKLITRIQQDIFNHFNVVSKAVVTGRPIDDQDLMRIVAENDLLKALVKDSLKHKLELDPEKMSARSITKARGFFRDFMPLYRETLGHIKNIAEALAGKK